MENFLSKISFLGKDKLLHLLLLAIELLFVSKRSLILRLLWSTELLLLFVDWLFPVIFVELFDKEVLVLFELFVVIYKK